MASSELPPNVPPDVPYLTVPSPSPLLSPIDRLVYCTPCPLHLLPNAPPRVAIEPLTDPRHPAKGQCGLFNASGKALERGSWIRDYIGWVHTEAEADPASGYDLALERRAVPSGDGEGEEVRYEVVGCDALRMGGEARFVNDYRGVPGFERPNAVFELRSWDIPGVEGRKGVRMAVWAGPHGVRAGAEICVSYGKGFWNTKGGPAAGEVPKARVGRGRRVAKVKKV
ncbi:hypothetical protein JCM10449v2_006636 [Rhodotorula kratochvilovae]